eukprot:5573840-Pyramimonas_sp.AAC.1
MKVPACVQRFTAKLGVSPLPEWGMSVGDRAARVTGCLQRAASKASRRDALTPIKPYISRAAINLVRGRRLVLRALRDFRAGS